MTFTNSQKTGVIATVFFHGMLLLFLLLMVLTLPAPPPQEEGFLVDFGNSPTGLGLEEPSAAEGIEKLAATKKVAPVTHSVSKPKPSNKAQDKGDEDLLTQEYEKTVQLAANAKKKIIRENKLKLDEERQLKAREEQQRRDEAFEKQKQEAEEFFHDIGLSTGVSR